jgi:hypothetical protein
MPAFLSLLSVLDESTRRHGGQLVLQSSHVVFSGRVKGEESEYIQQMAKPFLMYLYILNT